MARATTKRVYWLDLLRVIAALAVVCLHASAAYLTYKPNDLNWWVANVVESCVRWCVPVFVMISGSLLLAKPMEDSPTRFYRRYLTRALILVVVWTAFYLAFEASQTKTLTLNAALLSIYSGTPYYHLWYLYMLLGLYLVVPFINRFVWSSSRRWLTWAIIVSTGLAILYHVPWISAPNAPPSFFLTMFPSYIAFFLIGHYLTTAEKPILPAWAALLLAVACAAAIAALTAFLIPRLGASISSVTYSYFDPLVILMAVFVFLFMKAAFVNRTSADSPFARFVSWIAPLTLGIYVIHPVWIAFLRSLPTDLIRISATGILFTTVGAFVISTIVAIILRWIPLLRLTVS